MCATNRIEKEKKTAGRKNQKCDRRKYTKSKQDSCRKNVHRSQTKKNGDQRALSSYTCTNKQRMSVEVVKRGMK